MALRFAGVCAARGHPPPLRAANADYPSAVSESLALRAQGSRCLGTSNRSDRQFDLDPRPRLWRAVDGDLPADCLHTILESDESRPASGIRSADAVVSDREAER